MEAFPEDTAPQDLLRDRDRIYGADFIERIEGMDIKEVLTAPRSPWQRAVVERLIGSVRRECLHHVIVLGKDLCVAKIQFSRKINSLDRESTSLIRPTLL